MARSALVRPKLDPTPVFELARFSYVTELLTAAVSEFKLFDLLAGSPLSEAELRAKLQLHDRPLKVLLTAIKAMGLLRENAAGKVELTEMARDHLDPNGPFFIGEYISLSAAAPGVQNIIERLKTNKPIGAKPEDSGAAFIFREGMESAMEQEASARRLTLALSGRAKIVAPYLATNLDLSKSKVLLDIGGGTGIYTIACLQQYPHLKGIVWDRPEVLKVAQEFAVEYGVSDRLECRPGDMFADAIPPDCDVMLLSNVLHDWDIPECQQLIHKCNAALPAGGKIVIHDVYLNDALDGPLALAAYSAALFNLTEGRAYSAKEYRSWLEAEGLQVGNVIPTQIHCGLLIGLRK